MSDAFIQVPPDSTGKKVDQDQLVVGANTVHRQRIVLADPAAAAGLAAIKNAIPASSDYGLVVRQVPLNMQEAPIDISTAGDSTVIAAATPGRKVWKLWLWAAGDQTITLRHGATPFAGAIDLAQGGQILLPKDSDPWFTCADGAAFIVNTSTTARVSGRVYYT